jgi:hypothetical protein
MSSRLNYTSSPESDGEFCEPETPSRNISRQPSAEPVGQLARFNSDPNLAMEDTKEPEYNGVPPNVSNSPVSCVGYIKGLLY